MEDAKKGVLDMATELRELRGPPEAIQKQFDELQAKSDGKEKEKADPLLTIPQWEELFASNKKASSPPPIPAKAGLFTSACEKVKATALKTDFAASIPSHSSLDKFTRPSLCRRLALT